MELKFLLEEEIIDHNTYRSIKPIGSHIPKLYGRAKIHKQGVPLRLILSMVGSPYHSVAKWLCQQLEPIRRRLSKHSLKNTFDL